jgi:hypothetical protein
MYVSHIIAPHFGNYSLLSALENKGVTGLFLQILLFSL